MKYISDSFHDFEYYVELAEIVINVTKAVLSGEVTPAAARDYLRAATQKGL